MKTLVFTGGHHNSSLEVAKTLKSQGVNIIWFGHKYSMWKDTNVSGEYTDVTNAQIEFVDIKAGKFFHTYNPLKLIRIPLGFIQVFNQLRKISQKTKIDGIVSFGGYIAVPTVLVGYLLHIPSITHEQTVVQGLANLVIARFVKKIAVSWPGNSSNSKIVLTGLPLRNELLNSKIKTKKNLLYVTGGKQGSHLLNTIIFELVDELTSKYEIIHQTGSSSLYKDYETASLIKNPKYSHFAYDSRKGIESMLAADIVVSRSGAHTVYELAALNKKSVLVPIPWSSRNEQYENAQILVKNNQAVLVNQSELNKESLLKAINSASQLNPKKIEVPLDATKKIVNLIYEELLNEKNSS